VCCSQLLFGCCGRAEGELRGGEGRSREGERGIVDNREGEGSCVRTGKLREGDGREGEEGCRVERGFGM